MEATTDTKSTVALFDRASSQLQNTDISIVTTISCTFLLAMNRSIHAVLIKICMDIWNIAYLSRCFRLCWNALPTTSLFWNPLFCLHKWSARINEWQWMPFFSTWRNSVTHLCFIHTSMSDAILSDCPSAAIYCMATACYGTLMGSFNPCCCTNNICLSF